jgi:hypothetical protein
MSGGQVCHGHLLRSASPRSLCIERSVGRITLAETPQHEAKHMTHTYSGACNDRQRRG